MILRRFSWYQILRISILLFAGAFAFETLAGTILFAAGGGGEGGHGGVITPVLFSLVVILFLAKIGGDIAIRIKQPEVLGELIIGVVLGNLVLFGIDAFDYIRHDKALEILSELGVILLLFEVGLETNLKEMTQVGVSALLVALLGVVAPFFLGWGVSLYFVPEASSLVHIFVGATLTLSLIHI